MNCFFVLLLKGQFLERIYTITAFYFYGGLLYGPAVYRKIRLIRETGFSSGAPLFEKS
jgi:hypothetical protein